MMLTRKTGLFAALVFAANLACADDTLSASTQHMSGWVGTREEMASLNKFQQERAKQDALEIAAAMGKVKAKPGSPQGVQASPAPDADISADPVETIADSETPTYESSAGNISKYPIPCNEDDGLYVVDFRRQPPCDLTYPGRSLKGTEIQAQLPLSDNEEKQRKQRPHLTF